jgi:hypothetical protein
MFGQTLLKGMAGNVKENTAASQVFPSGFSKYISDGGRGDEKADPTTLPFSSKPNGGFSSAHMRNTSSGGGSFKSGSNTNETE